MQKIATRVFVFASVCFGAVGIVFWISAPRDTSPATDFNNVLFRLLGVTGFVVLSSFALSLAGKYLSPDDHPKA